MLTPSQYDTLIYKYLNGKLSPAEAEKLVSWLKQDPRNKDYFHKLKKTWQPMENAREDVREAYLEMQSKLAMNHSLTSQFKDTNREARRRWKQGLRIAAILIIGLITGYGVNSLKKQEPVTPEKLNYTKISTSPGEQSQVTLPDGSRVWLNAESSVRFASGGFMENRAVELSGEAYFQVEHLPSSDFTVKTNDYDIQVTGTEFNVMAYEDLKRTETTLVKGSITVRVCDKSIPIKPTEKITYQGGQYQIKKENTASNIAWREGIFHFDQTPLHELLRKLERWYNVRLILQDSSIKDIQYSGVFKNQETILDILEVIQMTTPIDYQKTGNREITITHKSNHKPNVNETQP
jgi:ferric-dicitrate binding protein FerR (iron transport regulator)